MSNDLDLNAGLPFLDDTIYEPLGAELFQLTLTRRNKAEIFEYALSTLSSSQRKSASVIANLHKWDPSVASLFTQRSFDTILNTPFRLIFPSSSLQSFEETGLYVRQYIAVSYCWRSPEFLSDDYRRHGDWPISKPFVDAILEDKDHPREGIWMDQLCIDQGSTEDKLRSVAAMDVIYKSCIRLVVLLEDVTLDTVEIELVKGRGFGDRKPVLSRKPGPSEASALISFYEKVNRARWWDRAWCFHEFNVNEPWSDKRQCNEIHNATFIIGAVGGKTIKMKWFTLSSIMVEALNVLLEESGHAVSAFKGQNIFIGVDRGDKSKDGWHASLMARYNGVAGKGCSQMPDRLSIMINMCGLGLAYAGGAIKSMDDFLYIGVLLALAAGEAYPMTTFDGTHASLNGKPTWLNHRTTTEFTVVRRFQGNSLNSVYRISPQKITLDLVFFSNMWESIDFTHMRATYAVFPETIPTTTPDNHYQGHFLDAMVSNHPDELYEEIRRTFLAGCVSNGYNFTARLWKQLQHNVVIPTYHTGNYKDLAPNPVLLTAARRLLEQLLPITSLLSLPSPEIFSLQDAHLFVTWLTDPRSIYYIFFTMNIRFGRQLDDLAFLTSKKMVEGFEKQCTKNLRLAIPKDLINESCMGLRVWILQPKGESEWRLVGKAFLLGEGDLMDIVKRKQGHDTKDEGESDTLWIERATIGG